IIRRLISPDFSRIGQVFPALLETLAIAISATLIGAFFSLLASFFAARKLGAAPLLVYFFKVCINLFRAFPPMITAIIFFRGLGPGPMAAVLSLSIYTFAVLSKLFYESLENQESSTLEMAKSLGASAIQTYRFVLLPSQFDRFLALALFRFESNLRNSALLGIVGAGGIGQQISMSLQMRAFEKAGLMILALAVLIFSFDRLSARLQKQLR
ncbi:MAG: ABC transporter permease subunit, partial [Eubacteriales bacterium]|nr:ABC transporter permease subunit [Eubacteriales bacterium]